MRTRVALLALAGISLGGCYYGPYGDPYLAGPAVVGAGVGAVAGAAIASGAPVYVGPPAYYGPRYYGYGYGYYPRAYGWRRW